MLKLGYTLPILAYDCLHITTTASFIPSNRAIGIYWGKIHEDLVGGPSIVFTENDVVDETFIQDSTNFCKGIVGIDASQLHSFSMCQATPTGLHTRWELDSESQNFKPRRNKMRSFENMVMSYFQRVRPQCKVKSFYTTATRKKMTHTVLMAFVDNETLCLKLWGLILIIDY